MSGERRQGLSAGRRAQLKLAAPILMQGRGRSSGFTIRATLFRALASDPKGLATDFTVKCESLLIALAPPFFAH